jgi:DNA-directed RNA polymerase specialized sigma24 family protein
MEAPNVALLIAGCRRREEASQLALYRHFYSYGMGICLRYARNRESAMEMLNDGFLKVFQKIEQYDSAMAFKPWLRKVLVHAAIDHYRKYEKERLDSFWQSGPASFYHIMKRFISWILKTC